MQNGSGEDPLCRQVTADKRQARPSSDTSRLCARGFIRLRLQGRARITASQSSPLTALAVTYFLRFPEAVLKGGPR